MRLGEALELRRVLVERTGVEYTVGRSGRRRMGVAPFFVARRSFVAAARRAGSPPAPVALVEQRPASLFDGSA